MMQPLLELQDLDTARDRLLHRLGHLEELAVAAGAREQLIDWERVARSLADRLAQLHSTIVEVEQESAEIDTALERLTGQLRQVIAVREAEALQHEIAELGQRRSALDDDGLAALEEQAELEAQMSQHATAEVSLRQALEEADHALAIAQSDLESELARVDAQRLQVRGGVESGWLDRYERLRAQLGVVVVRLEGAECVGCPFQLSPGELQVVRDAPGDAPIDCPQCGRLIVK